METFILRRPSSKNTTLGKWVDENGALLCYTLEDQVREIPGVDVRVWKIKNETAIPKGRYRITMEVSGRFGPDTLTLNNVPGFSAIRVHGGNTHADTEGCIIIGSSQSTLLATVSGAKAGALSSLKASLKPHLPNLWVTIKEAP